MANPSLIELKELREKLERIIKLINILMHLGRQGGSKVALEVETILIASLQNGLNITQACLQAGIARSTYYDEVARNPEFSDKMEKAEQFGSMSARRNVIAALQAKDPTMTRWYLERKDPDFKPRTESDLLSGGQPLKTALVEFVGDDGNPKSQD